MTGENKAIPPLLMVHADHLGRPVRLTDATRATVWQASYDPFGQPWQVTGSVEQNLRFPGQYFLIETGLAYNWHRFYDPATGRYTQPDPLRFVDGPSVYGYAGQSPLIRVDLTGLQEIIPPLEGFPWDPTVPPGPGWEWKGPSEPGQGPGNWVHPDDGSLNPDLDHPPPVGPHYDWKAPSGDWYRWFPDGTLKPKSPPLPIKPEDNGCIAGL